MIHVADMAGWMVYSDDHSCGRQLREELQRYGYVPNTVFRLPENETIDEFRDSVAYPVYGIGEL